MKKFPSAFLALLTVVAVTSIVLTGCWKKKDTTKKTEQQADSAKTPEGVSPEANTVVEPVAEEPAAPTETKPE